VHEKYGASVIAAWPVPKKDVSQYGIMAGKKVDAKTIQIKEFVEKPSIDKAPSNLAVVGKYIVTPDIVDELRKVKTKGEIRLANAFENYLKKGGKLYAHEFEGVRYDCGSKLGLLEATVAFGLSHPETAKGFKAYLKSFSF
jgi:UTP--glucose-1-phosphate uridylyltransferase